MGGEVSGRVMGSRGAVQQGAAVVDAGHHALGHAPEAYQHTGSDVEELKQVGGDGVMVGHADWFVMSEAILLDERDREVLRRACHREAMALEGEMLQGDDYPAQRIVIAVKSRQQAVDVAMRCFQASAGKIHFRVLEARAMYAAFDFEQTLRHVWLALPTIEQELEILKQQHAGDHGLVRQLDDLRRTVRPMIDEIERILTDAERIEDEKVDRAKAVIRSHAARVSSAAGGAKAGA